MSDAEDFELLPSHNRELLAGAIGRRLVEVERIFTLDLNSFVEGGLRDPKQFFRRNSGPTRFLFDGGFSLSFGEWGEQLSVVILHQAFEPDVEQRICRLSGSGDGLASLLGRICRDVRVWTYREDFETSEAMECAVSFLLDEDAEIFYCTWLHGDMDADYVLPRKDVPLQRAAACYSVLRGATIPLDGVSDV